MPRGEQHNKLLFYLSSEQNRMRCELLGACAVCERFKHKFLNAAEVRMLPHKVLFAYAVTTFVNTHERDYTLLSLLLLLGAIATGVSALAGLGNIAVGIVLNSQQYAEEQLHNCEI